PPGRMDDDPGRLSLAHRDRRPAGAGQSRRRNPDHRDSSGAGRGPAPGGLGSQLEPAGSVSVRTLTGRSPGGRDGWAFGNPIGPSRSPPTCRPAGRLSRRTTTGFRRPTRLSRPPRGARAAESCIEGLSWNTAITADLKPACRRKVAGTQSLPAAHESFATRVLDPTLSGAQRAGGVGGALGNPSSYVG